MDYNLQGDIIPTGIRCVVRADFASAEGNDPKVIGLVQNASVRKAINIARAEVIGHILPASLDATGIQVSISLKGFIPAGKTGENPIVEKVKNANGGSPDGYSVKNLNPSDDALIMENFIVKIPYLDLYDARHEQVIGYTQWAIVTSYNESINGKGYVEADVSLESIGYKNGTGYESTVASILN